MGLSPRRASALGLAAAVFFLFVPAFAQAASVKVSFPQAPEITVVQGQTAGVDLEVTALGAVPCSATTVPVLVDSFYSLDAVGDVAAALPVDLPITTTSSRGDSTNCYIQSPSIVPLTVSVAPETPVGDYTGVVRYGKGGDGDIDLDGPPLTIHVVASPPPLITPPQLILGDREPAPHPTLGKTVMLTPVKGNVVFRSPGNGVKKLTKTIVVPNGTVIDALNGVLKVTVERDHTGATDSVDAWGGGFKALQTVPAGRGLTTFTLSGKPAGSSRKVASAARKRRSHRRLLWVNGKGNFRTRGKRASAIVRGTYWVTEETNAGTRVAVTRGLVAVRDFTNARTVLVSRGQSYTAPTHRMRRVPAFTGSVRR